MPHPAFGGSLGWGFGYLVPAPLVEGRGEGLRVVQVTSNAILSPQPSPRRKGEKNRRSDCIDLSRNLS